MSDKEIGERLKIARRHAGFASAAEAADALGMRYPTYAGHENGTRGLGRAAEQYARRYGVSLDWLLTGRGSGPARQSPGELIRGENEIKAVLSRIEGLPEAAIHPIYRVIMGFVEDAEQSTQGHSPAQTAPANRHRVRSPSE